MGTKAYTSQVNQAYTSSLNQAYPAGESEGAPVVYDLEDLESLVLVNGATYSDGELTLVRSSSQYAWLPDSDDYDTLGGDMKIEVSFKFNSVPTGTASANYFGILGKHTGGSLWVGWMITSAKNLIRIFANDGTPTGADGTNYAVTWATGHWYTVVVIYSNTLNNMTVTLDGVEIMNKIPNDFPAQNTNYKLHFGASPTNGDGNIIRYFDGQIKDVRITQF